MRSLEEETFAHIFMVPLSHCIGYIEMMLNTKFSVPLKNSMFPHELEAILIKYMSELREVYCKLPCLLN